MQQDEGWPGVGIVYGSNMNIKTIKPYLDMLIKNGLLETGDARPIRYKTTQKGKKVLEHLRVFEEPMPEL